MKRIHWSLLLLIGISFLVYLSSLSNDFVAFDDELLIIDNPTIKGLNLEHVTEAFTTYDPELYIPVTLLTYQVEYSLFGLNPLVFHITSLLIHLLSVWCVYRLLRYFFSESVALGLGLLFAVHPLNVEAVAWASGRKDLIASMFFFLTCLLYLRYRESGKGFWWSVVTFALGLASKVSIVFLPFVLVLFDWVAGRKLDRSSWKEKLPYFTLSGLFIIIALAGKAGQASAMGTSLLMMFVAIPFYLQKFVLPIGLSIFYPFHDPLTFMHPRVLMGIVTVGILVGVIYRQWKKDRVLVSGLLLFFLMLLPSFVNVIKGGDDASHDLYIGSDRYVYAAMLGLLIVIGSLVSRWKMHWSLPAIVIVVLGFLAYQQSIVWQSSIRLFESAAASGYRSHVAFMNLGSFAAKDGDLDRAVELYQESIAIKPSGRALQSLAEVRLAEGKNTQAFDLLQQAVHLRPHDPSVFARLGHAAMLVGDAPRAFSALERAVELNPGHAGAHFNLGILYEYAGQRDRAIAEFRRVLELDPNDEQAKRKLGQI